MIPVEHCALWFERNTVKGTYSKSLFSVNDRLDTSFNVSSSTAKLSTNSGAARVDFKPDETARCLEACANPDVKKKLCRAG